MPAGAKSSSGGRAAMHPMRKLFLAVISTALWMLASSALIILNKRLYGMGFDKPCFVTGMGQFFSLLGGLALIKAGFLPLRKLPNLG